MNDAAPTRPAPGPATGSTAELVVERPAHGGHFVARH